MLHTETIVTLSEAAKALPRINGKRPHASTLWRWARKGIGGTKLEVRRVGRRIVTSLEALERFSKALADVELPETSPELTRDNAGEPRRHLRSVSSAREAAHAAAEAELDAAGI